MPQTNNTGDDDIDILEYHIQLRKLASECVDQYFSIFLREFQIKEKVRIHEFIRTESSMFDYANDEYHENWAAIGDVLSTELSISISDSKAYDEIRKLYLKDFKFCVGQHLVERLEVELASEIEHLRFAKKSLVTYQNIEATELTKSTEKHIERAREYIKKMKGCIRVQIGILEKRESVTNS